MLSLTVEQVAGEGKCTPSRSDEGPGRRRPPRSALPQHRADAPELVPVRDLTTTAATDLLIRDALPAGVATGPELPDPGCRRHVRQVLQPLDHIVSRTGPLATPVRHARRLEVQVLDAHQVPREARARNPGRHAAFPSSSRRATVTLSGTRYPSPRRPSSTATQTGMLGECSTSPSWGPPMRSLVPRRERSNTVR